VRLTEGRHGIEGYYVHLETERSRMAIMLTLQCPVPVHSRVVILPSARGTAWVFDLYVSVVAECYNLFVLILMHSTEYSVHSICKHTTIVLLYRYHSSGMKILPGRSPIPSLLKQGQLGCTLLHPECLLHLTQFLPALKDTCV